MDRLELAAADGDDGVREPLQWAASLHERAADVANGHTVIVPEIGDGLEVRRQLLGEPHERDIALGFALRLDWMRLR